MNRTAMRIYSILMLKYDTQAYKIAKDECNLKDKNHKIASLKMTY